MSDRQPLFEMNKEILAWDILRLYDSLATGKLEIGDIWPALDLQPTSELTLADWADIGSLALHDLVASGYLELTYDLRKGTVYVLMTQAGLDKLTEILT